MVSIAMSPLHCFNIVYVNLGVLYDDALTELVNHFANETLNVY